MSALYANSDALAAGLGAVTTAISPGAHPGTLTVGVLEAGAAMWRSGTSDAGRLDMLADRRQADSLIESAIGFYSSGISISSIACPVNDDLQGRDYAGGSTMVKAESTFFKGAEL
ncbi:hypothetical protein HDU96_009171 [Phlyctochytrium bullatum]|nr:hypothetical protein HDU96_009171 [Phlyctochytrium bullatum]